MSDWNEWSKHVLAELKRNDRNVENLDVKLDSIMEKLIGLEKELLVFKTKASVAGGIAGFAVMVVLEIVKGFK